MHRPKCHGCGRVVDEDAAMSCPACALEAFGLAGDERGAGRQGSTRLIVGSIVFASTKDPFRTFGVITDLPEAIDFKPLFDMFEPQGAMCCIACKSEIDEGCYHGCRAVKWDEVM